MNSLSLPLFLSSLNYKYFTQKYVIWSPSSDLFPFAHYCIDRLEHRTKLNRQTGDMQHCCNRCFLFQLSFLLCCPGWHLKGISGALLPYFNRLPDTQEAPEPLKQARQSKRNSPVCSSDVLFASQPSSRSISVSRREPGGLRWEHKGKQTPTTPLQPPFLRQAGRNELLNGDAAAHGKTCVNEVSVKITAEVHGTGAKRRRASFMWVKFTVRQTQKIICWAWNSHAWRQADVEM